MRVTAPIVPNALACAHPGVRPNTHIGGSVRHVSLYAAYGSNMDPEQMRTRCPHSPLAGVAWLHGHRLTFGGEDLGWEGALATVVPDSDAKVFVALYELSDQDEANLDQWEGADTGLYVKLRVRVSPLAQHTGALAPPMEGATQEWLESSEDPPDLSEFGALAALGERPEDAEPEPLELLRAAEDGPPPGAPQQLAWLYVLDGYEGGLPSARYLGVMADAAEAAGAPGAYVEALRARECRSLGG